MKKAIKQNQQLAFSNNYQIAAQQDDLGIICDTMQYENLVCSDQDPLASHIVSYVDLRSDIGKILNKKKESETAD